MAPKVVNRVHEADRSDAPTYKPFREPLHFCHERDRTALGLLV